VGGAVDGEAADGLVGGAGLAGLGVADDEHERCGAKLFVELSVGVAANVRVGAGGVAVAVEAGRHAEPVRVELREPGRPAVGTQRNREPRVRGASPLGGLLRTTSEPGEHRDGDREGDGQRVEDDDQPAGRVLEPAGRDAGRGDDREQHAGGETGRFPAPAGRTARGATGRLAEHAGTVPVRSRGLIPERSVPGHQTGWPDRAAPAATAAVRPRPTPPPWSPPRPASAAGCPRPGRRTRPGGPGPGSG
jgi:hypothetical protein